MTTDLEARRLDTIVQAIADRVAGDWLLVGGALVALWLNDRRVTEDVDIVGIAGTGADRLALFGLAEGLGLPVEALNSAAEFFVQKIPDWSEQVELFRAGQCGRVFRPSPTLFLLLKLGRLSSQDLEDCLDLVRRCAREGLALDARRVQDALNALPPVEDDALAVRRARLAEAVRFA